MYFLATLYLTLILYVSTQWTQLVIYQNKKKSITKFSNIFSPCKLDNTTLKEYITVVSVICLISTTSLQVSTNSLVGFFSIAYIIFSRTLNMEGVMWWIETPMLKTYPFRDNLSPKQGILNLFLSFYLSVQRMFKCDRYFSWNVFDIFLKQLNSNSPELVMLS